VNSCEFGSNGGGETPRGRCDAPVDKEDAQQAGQVRAALASIGTPIGPYDVLVAGQAVARDMILVTHNTREFARVPGLRVEDWQA
jgi:tRNA(fMet)-specific endonuclease VapC